MTPNHLSRNWRWLGLWLCHDFRRRAPPNCTNLVMKITFDSPYTATARDYIVKHLFQLATIEFKALEAKMIRVCCASLKLTQISQSLSQRATVLIDWLFAVFRAIFMAKIFDLCLHAWVMLVFYSFLGVKKEIIECFIKFNVCVISRLNYNSKFDVSLSVSLTPRQIHVKTFFLYVLETWLFDP